MTSIDKGIRLTPNQYACAFTFLKKCFSLAQLVAMEKTFYVAIKFRYTSIFNFNWEDG